MRIRPLSVALCAWLAACGADAPCSAPTLTSLPEAPSFAVALSDYSSSAIALLDAEGEVITEAWIDSSTRASNLAPGVRGDVELPGRLLDGQLALLERWNSDLLTLVPFDDPTPRQIDVRGDRAGGQTTPVGASPNAQDALALDATHALVSRANPSLTPGTPELALGNDVALVDLIRGEVLARIDLDADTTVPHPLDPARTEHVYARPAQMTLLTRDGKRRVVVGLARLDLTHLVSGPGAVAVLDPDARERTQLLELPSLEGCGAVAAVASSPHEAIALCTGPSFTDEAGRRPRAGLVRLTLGEHGDVEVTQLWRASDHPEAPSPTSSPVGLDGEHALFVADPRADEGIDQLVRLSFATGQTSVLFEAGASFVLGEGAWSPEDELLLWPDADARAVHRFVGAPATLRWQDSVPLPTCRTLPPRQVTALRPRR